MSVANPSRSGWYWLYERGNPHKPLLYKVDIPVTCFSVVDVSPISTPSSLFNRLGKDAIPESWNYINRGNRVEHLVYLGKVLPPRLMPSKPGFYWVVSQHTGHRYIVKISQYCNGELRAEIIGDAMVFAWLDIVEMYQVLRIDFIGDLNVD